MSSRCGGTSAVDHRHMTLARAMSTFSVRVLHLICFMTLGPVNLI